MKEIIKQVKRPEMKFVCTRCLTSYMTDEWVNGFMPSCYCPNCGQNNLGTLTVEQKREEEERIKSLHDGIA